MNDKIKLKIMKTEDGEYMASSPESMGFFAIGETREEVIQNAKEGLSLFLDMEEDEIDFDIEEEE
jgi:predicted RNase H-like HicB family nuclease